jgi:superfamily I DNA and/or RNA helicase
LKSLNCKPSLEIAYSNLLSLKADVEKGEFLECNSALDYAGAFQSWNELKEASSLVATLTTAVARDRKISNQEHEILENLQVQYSEQEVASCRSALTEAATILEVEAPDFQSAKAESVLEFSDRLRKAAESIHARRERWPILRESLLQYHARLAAQGVDLKRAVIHEANVIAATCSGIAGAKDFDPVFDYVIIDEAGRATPLDLLIPMVRGKTIVLVGDYKQLPPMLDKDISDDLAASEAAEVPLFERLFNNSASSRKQALSSQYRMVQDICDVVSDISYWPDQTLETCGIARNRHHPFPGLKPIHWIKCDGRLNRAEKSGGHSLRNRCEILAAVQTAERLALRLNEIRPDRPYEVGIISMYRGQVAALEDALPSSVTDCPYISIQLGTVDAFQGREKDAIILSFVATDPGLNYFFFDRRRLNVALSRAKELLVLIGGLDILGRRSKVFGKENPVARLRSLIEESLLVDGASKETFYAE